MPSAARWLDPANDWDLWFAEPTVPTAAVTSRVSGLLPTAQAVLAIRRRPTGQNRESHSARPAHPAADPNPVVAFVVGLFPPPAMTGDRVLAAPRTPSWQERQRKCSHPGSDLSSGSDSAINRNHGRREGPPLTVFLAGEFRSVEGLHPPEYSIRTKKEYCRLTLSANVCILAIGRYTAVFRPEPGPLLTNGDGTSTLLSAPNAPLHWR